MNANVLLVFCTCPDEAKGKEIAEVLVRERFAACVNVIPALTSVYRWEDGVEQDTEVLLLIKTAGDRFPALTSRMLELHPYELPEIIAAPVADGLPDYLQWVTTCSAVET